MLVCLSLVAQARSRLDSFPKKSHRQPSRWSIPRRHARGSRNLLLELIGRSGASPDLCAAQPNPATPPLLTKPA
jgi:hypothetical protein